LSETLTPEPLKPDTDEEIAELRHRLEVIDAIISVRNQEIAALQSRLAGKDEIIAEADEQITRLESELASRPEQNPAPIAIGAGLPEPADLLNKLLGMLPKSKTTMKDATAILEILEEG